MPKNTTADDFHFEGFANPTTTPVPDVVFDRFLAKLGEAELKALLYIIRRTFGFKRTRDLISFNQFIRGITTRDGRVLDQGCGIRDRTTLSKALRSLEEKGIVRSEKGTDEKGENVTTVYSLHFKDDGDDRVVGIPYHRGMDRPLPVVGNSYPQQTVLQETGEQQTDISKIRMAPPHEKRNVDNSQAAITKHEANESTIREVTTREKNGEHDEFEPLSAIIAPKNFRQPRHVYDEARQVIGDYLRDYAIELGDDAKLASSITRAVNLYRKSELDLSTFVNVLVEARSRTQQSTAQIKKRRSSATGPFPQKNKIPYFFGVVETLLGLKERSPGGASQDTPSP